MRHYDRTDFRHLNDAERYRDHDYMADDGWMGPNEHERFDRATSFEGVGPRRPPRAPTPSSRHGFLDTILHPRQAMERVVRGLFHGRGPKNWQRSTQRIHDEVCERLARHHDVDASDMEVEVEDGEVTLTGTVSDRRMKVLAEDAIEDVLGVKDVHNRLRVIVPSRPARVGR